MSVRVHPAMAMRPDSEPPAASQRWAAVWRSRCGRKPWTPARWARRRRARLSPSRPNCLPRLPSHRSGAWARGCCARWVEVCQQRLGGGLADRDGPARSAFPAADGDQASDEVEVVEAEADELSGADGGLKHEPDDGLVAAMVQPLPHRRGLLWDGAGAEEGAQLGIGEWLDQGGWTRGAFMPGNESTRSSPPAVSQAANRRTACCRMRAVPGAAPASSMPATHWLRQARLIGRLSCSAHQRR